MYRDAGGVGQIGFRACKGSFLPLCLQPSDATLCLPEAGAHLTGHLSPGGGKYFAASFLGAAMQ